MTASAVAAIERKIDEAQERADDAAQAFAEVEHLLYDTDGAKRTEASQARERMRGAGQVVDHLIAERRYAQRAAVAEREKAAAVLAANEAHAAVEQEAKKDLDDLVDQLAASRGRVAKASSLAVKALQQAFDAAQAHDALVRAGAKQLRARGLVLDDDKLSLKWETGAAANEVLKIGGKWWLPVSANAILVRAEWAAARSRVGMAHELTRRSQYYFGVDRLDTRPDDLLKDAPLPPAFVPPAPFSWPMPAHDKPKPALAGSSYDSNGVYDRTGKKIG